MMDAELPPFMSSDVVMTRHGSSPPTYRKFIRKHHIRTLKVSKRNLHPTEDILKAEAAEMAEHARLNGAP